MPEIAAFSTTMYISVDSEVATPAPRESSYTDFASTLLRKNKCLIVQKPLNKQASIKQNKQVAFRLRAWH